VAADLWRTCAFTLRLCEALFPPPLDETDWAELEEGRAMTTGEAIPGIDDPEAVKAEWQGRLNSLVDEVDGWARTSGWRTRQIAKTVKERRLGTYRVPVLLMEKDTGSFCEDPMMGRPLVLSGPRSL